jgi:hypothetical protein
MNVHGVPSPFVLVGFIRGAGATLLGFYLFTFRQGADGPCPPLVAVSRKPPGIKRRDWIVMNFKSSHDRGEPARVAARVINVKVMQGSGTHGPHAVGTALAMSLFFAASAFAAERPCSRLTVALAIVILKGPLCSEELSHPLLRVIERTKPTMGTLVTAWSGAAAQPRDR